MGFPVLSVIIWPKVGRRFFRPLSFLLALLSYAAVISASWQHRSPHFLTVLGVQVHVQPQLGQVVEEDQVRHWLPPRLQGRPQCQLISYNWTYSGSNETGNFSSFGSYFYIHSFQLPERFLVKIKSTLVRSISFQNIFYTFQYALPLEELRFSFL
jgi:hypothetical protein